jgi:hypothetical protein
MSKEIIHYFEVSEITVLGALYSIVVVYCQGKIYEVYPPAAAPWDNFKIISASFTGFVTKNPTRSFYERNRWRSAGSLGEQTLYVKDIIKYPATDGSFPGGNITLGLPKGMWLVLRAKIDEYNSGGTVNMGSGQPLDNKMFEI